MLALRLHCIDQAPRDLPVWESIRNDLGDPPARQIAKALGVGVSTVHRWNATGSAPRMACLALFWLTRWGRSEVHSRAANDAALMSQLASSLERENAELRMRAAMLTQELDEKRALLSARGTCPSDAQSHTGTGHDGASVLAMLEQLLQRLLAHPAAPCPAAPDSARPVAPPEVGHPGTPATPPPAARSGKSPAPARSVQPLLSAPPAVWPSSPPSSPSDTPCIQNGVIVPSLRITQEDFPPLLAGGGKANPAGATAPTGRLGASVRRATEPEWQSIRAPSTPPTRQVAAVTRVIDGRVVERRPAPAATQRTPEQAPASPFDALAAALCRPARPTSVAPLQREKQPPPGRGQAPAGKVLASSADMTPGLHGRPASRFSDAPSANPPDTWAMGSENPTQKLGFG